MRKLSFGLAIGFVLVACGGGGEEAQPPKAPEPVATAPAPTVSATAEAPKEEPKKESPAELQAKTLKAYGEALNAHDAKKLAGLYADNAVVKVAGAPDSTGRDAIAASYQKLFDAFSNYKSAPSRIFTKNDVAVVEWAFNGTHSGDLWGIKATEKPVGAQGVDVFWFDDKGQIKEQHVYYDGNTILAQAGVSKHKARPIPALPTAMPQPVTSSGSPEEQKNVDAVKAMDAALESKKEADFLATVADNVEYDDMTQPQTMKGKADAKKFFKEMTTAFPDAKFQVVNSWGFGDIVVAEGSMTGTNKGAFFGMPATKKPLSMKSIDIYQFKDGKLVHGWSYGNGADMMMQLGLMPQPKAGDAKAGDAKAGDAKAGDAKKAPATGDAKATDKKAAPAAGDTKAAPTEKKPADKAAPKK